MVHLGTVLLTAMVALSAVSAKPSRVQPSRVQKRNSGVLYPRTPAIKAHRNRGRKHARVVRRQAEAAGATSPTDTASLDAEYDDEDYDDDPNDYYMDPEEAAYEAEWQAYNQAIMQNSCASNVPLGLDATRMNDRCKQYKGTVISMDLPNKTALPYMSSIPTGTASANPFAASPTPKTYAPSKATIYACMCSSTPVPTGVLNMDSQPIDDFR